MSSIPDLKKAKIRSISNEGALHKSQLNQGIYLLRLHVENEVFMHKIMVSY